MNSIEQSPLYRRVRQHAERRLCGDTYREPSSWMEELRQFVRLEKECCDATTKSVIQG